MNTVNIEGRYLALSSSSVIHEKMKSILDIEVSCYKNYKTPESPVNINLLSWLKSKKYASQVSFIRQLESKSERDKVKAALPGITPSGLFSYRHEFCLIQHSGFIQFDIDFKENSHISNYKQLKEQICKISNVAYCGLSVSGTGYWGLIPIAYPDKHKQHFESLQKAFESFSIVLDPAPANVASLRGYSYDADAYFNHSASILSQYEKPVPKPTLKSFIPNLNDDQVKVEACIREIERRRIDITTSYHFDWLPIASNFADTFGESGRIYFQLVSQFHPEYESRKTDIQYDKCLKANRGAASLGTFLSRCAAHGIYYKEAVPFLSTSAVKAPELKPDSQLTKEFYHYSFDELVRFVGYAKALQRVKQYQELSMQYRKCETFVIHDCILLKTYDNAQHAQHYKRAS